MSDQDELFGFEFIGPNPQQDRNAEDYYDGLRPQDVDRQEWGVWLPHQCDEWVIVAEPTREKALAELDRFIAEATAIRALLAKLDS